jgi:hypothetical protein
MQLVGVHGIWNHVKGGDPTKIAATKSAEWREHVARGLGCAPGKLDLRVAYWAPILHDGVPTSQSLDEDGDAALNRLEAEDGQAAELARQWLEAQDLPNAVSQGRLAVPLRHAVTFLARQCGRDGQLTKVFVAMFFKEVTQYLTGPQERREAVRAHVANCIAKAMSDGAPDQAPVVVLAHSLGSVVAFEALHARPDLQVDLLITLGSPLAIPRAVFHRLQPAPVGDVGLRPPNVRRWLNISDAGDLVAIPRPLTTYFPDIDLDLSDSIGLFNFHLVGGYLASPAVAASLLPLLS